MEREQDLLCHGEPVESMAQSLGKYLFRHPFDPSTLLRAGSAQGDTSSLLRGSFYGKINRTKYQKNYEKNRRKISFT